MTIEEKVALFEALKEQAYVLKDNQSAQDILNVALSEIGNTDPYIRDNLAVETAAYMIYKDYLTKTQLEDLSQRLLSDDFLFYGLKEGKEDSVFTRTFTSLLIAMLFRIPNKAVPLSNKALNAMYETYLRYLKDEVDYRGFVKDKGWAHFFAHSSDVLAYFFQEPTFDNTWLSRYIDVIQTIIQNTHYSFHHNEDQRFKNAFMHLLKREDIDRDIIHTFIKTLVDYKREKVLPDDIISFVNVKNILHELYFSIDSKDNLKPLIHSVIDGFEVY